MTKRTVFTAAEVKHLTESPAALLAAADYHYVKDTEADASDNQTTFHSERANELVAEAKRLEALYDDGEGPDYKEASQLVTGLHLQDLIDFCEKQIGLFDTNLAMDQFDRGYVMACERVIKKLKEVDGTYLEQRDSNGNLLFTYSSIHKGEFTKDPIPLELEVSDTSGHKVKFVRDSQDDGVWPRYFSQIGDGPKHRITKAQFISLERSCGFRPKSGNRDDCATGGFGHGDVYGSVEYKPKEKP